MIKLNLNPAECQAHYLVARQHVLNRIPGILNNGIMKDGTRHHPDQAMRNYLTALLNDPLQLKQLLTLPPDQLLQTFQGLKASNTGFFKKDSPSNLILKNLFVEHAYKNLDKLELIKRINVDTCPYCNRNYIYYLLKDGEIKPQIDHFYPTSKYPILAVSYYNLIPSCQTCNGFGAKEENDPHTNDLINPYLLTNKEFRFTYTINHIDVLNPLASKYGIDVHFLRKLDGHLKIFKLDKLYAQHADHVLELIIKSKVKYVETYRKVLRDFEGFDFSEDEIDRMVLGNYASEEDVHKRPFAKLYREIGGDLGLIKTIP